MSCTLAAPPSRHMSARVLRTRLEGAQRDGDNQQAEDRDDERGRQRDGNVPVEQLSTADGAVVPRRTRAASRFRPARGQTGSVEITRVITTYTKDNYNGDKRNVRVEVKNSGSSATNVDIWQSWIS